MNTITNRKITSFTQLIVWQEAHKLVLMVYRVTKTFPKEELFALTNQLRRAVVSITSNIAEGFSRNSAKDKNHFYSLSLGSLTETDNQLIVARDVGYLNQNQTNFNELANQSIKVNKLIHGLMKTAEDRV